MDLMYALLRMSGIECKTQSVTYLVLDKEATSYNDIFNAFRLALKFYHFEDSRINRLSY
jgi:hypothetical protein